MSIMRIFIEYRINDDRRRIKNEEQNLDNLTNNQIKAIKKYIQSEFNLYDKKNLPKKSLKKKSSGNYKNKAL